MRAPFAFWEGVDLMERNADPMRLWLGSWGTDALGRPARRTDQKPEASLPPDAPGPADLATGVDPPESR